MNVTRVLAGLAFLTLAACSNTVASLSYNPPASVQPVSTPRVLGVTSIDQRKESSHRIATIMGGFGNPLKTLDTTEAVKDEVATAFTKGLNARGMLSASGAPLRLVLTIRKFDADMIIGRTARIDLTVSMVDVAGHSVFEQAVMDSTSDYKFLETGVFAKIEDLQAMCQIVLDRTVDKVLDNPAFRAALAPVGV